MTDLLFHGDNYDAFLEEAYNDNENLVGKDEDGNYFTKYPKTPMKMNDAGEFILLVRTSNDTVGLFARLSTIHNLGAYVAVLGAPPKREIYDRIYDQTPVEVDDGNGGTITITPPEKFGVFL